jgi:hypothetical protein
MAFAHTAAKAKADTKKGVNENDSLATRRMNHALHGEFHFIPKKEKAEYRASALPFCPILHLEASKLNDTEIKEKPVVGWRQNFYLDIGTTVHALWQRVLTRAVRDRGASVKTKPYGAWKCTHCWRELPAQFLPEPCNCGPYTEKQFVELRIEQVKRTHPTFDPKQVAAAAKYEYRSVGCYPDWDYVEVSIEWEGLTGHVDYIEYYPDYNYWNVTDLKTAGSQAVKYAEKQLPVVKNIFQIETYAAILPCLFDEITHINEYSLFYHTRESATQHHFYTMKWDQKRCDRAWRRIDRWSLGYAASVKYLAKPKHDPDAMLDVVNTRPCFDDKSYDREMLPGFVYEDKKGECRYKKFCTTCEGPTLARKLYAAIEERVANHKD